MTEDIKRTVLPLMLLGDAQVGKTSMILKLIGNEFNDSQLTTVGKESYIYQININGQELKMKIWDTAGQERFRSMSSQVIKNSDAVILVYAIDNKNSFLAIEQWLNKINDLTDLTKKPIIIVGNKSDLDDSLREVEYEEGKKYAYDKGYKFFETSSKTGVGIKESFEEIFNQLYKIYEKEIIGDKKVNINSKGKSLSKKKNIKKKKCCIL